MVYLVTKGPTKIKNEDEEAEAGTTKRPHGKTGRGGEGKRKDDNPHLERGLVHI